jgi:hypothetical protein
MTTVAEASLHALADVVGVPLVAAELWARRKALSDDLVNIHESFRNDGRIDVADFIRHAAGKIRLRNLAERRLAELNDTRVAELPARSSPAAEIFALLMKSTLRKDQAIEWLRGWRLQLLDQVLAELAEVNAGIKGISEIHASPQTWDIPSRAERDRGIETELDFTLDHLAPLVRKRDHLTRQLERLDGITSPTGAAVAAAIEQHGGRLAVADAIADRATGLDPRVLRASNTLGQLEAKYRLLDPDSQSAAALVPQIAAAKTGLERATAEAAESRHRSAELLIEKATAGRLDAFCELLVKASEPLKAALDAARGSESQLVGTIEAMISSE